MAEFKHRRLEVWQDARNLVKRIYATSARFPKAERFGLVDQINRAAVSVPSNIAEGSSRETLPDQSAHCPCADDPASKPLNFKTSKLLN